MSFLETGILTKVNNITISNITISNIYCIYIFPPLSWLLALLLTNFILYKAPLTNVLLIAELQIIDPWIHGSIDQMGHYFQNFYINYKIQCVSLFDRLSVFYYGNKEIETPLHVRK